MPADAPFVNRPVGDEAAARSVAEGLASRLGAGAPMLVRSAMNATYVAGDVIVRVGRTTAPGDAAYRLADVLGAAGIRVPAPDDRRLVEHDGELTATAWRRILPVGAGIDWREVGEMVGRVHGLDPSAVGDYPVPSALTFPWWQFDRMIADATPLVDTESLAALTAAAQRVRGWEHSVAGGDWVLCHGDVHPHNVVVAVDGPVILDWDLLCIAPAAWDQAPLLSMVRRWGADPAWYAAFTGGAGDAGPLVERLTEGRLLAATLMRVLAEGPTRGDDSEASRRLRWWRGDPDAPTWSVV